MIKYQASVDPNVDDICNEFCKRAEHGKKKYGVTTEREDLTFDQWLQHLKEELMDGIVYIQKVQSIREKNLHEGD